MGRRSRGPEGDEPKEGAVTFVPLLKLVQVGQARVSLPPITCPHHAGELAAHLLDGADREQFVAIHLDTKLRLLSAEVVAIGTLNALLVHPREVYKGALLSNADSIIVAHNHPSGDTTPSAEDLALTETLIRAGKVLGIQLRDHLIVGETTRSLRETTSLWLASSEG